MTESAIASQDLTKFYGQVRGIENLDLRIDQGEVFGLLGPNGAGKTTTIRLLLDLIRPTRGQVTILGHDCHRESLAVRRSIGYLPGEFNLYENLTGRQLLTYLGSLRGGFDFTFVDTLVERLGAAYDRQISTLSHGNKQKLALILAFAPQPEVLILDEPTNGLDPLVRQVFHELVREARSQGHTVLLSSHDLTEVEKTCDRIASVRDGRLIAVETVSALRQSAMRVVYIECAHPLSSNPFDSLPSVDQLQIDGCHLHCRVRGPLGPLLAAAAHFEILDVLSREPHLEEFFLALYGKQENNHAQ
ncbi:MAG: ABC transporter ATP-binding protein [bacterium]|nr:ABC transporter ATP-binding protein [bacterium]